MKKIRSYLLYSKSQPEKGLKVFLKRLFRFFLKKERVCHVALAGGRTPLELYHLLSEEKLPWDRLRFYLSDERYAPLNSELSNYNSVKRALGKRARLAFFKTEMPPEECALDYELQLPERLHIALLGVGADGHTASLFPETECREVSQKVCLSRSPDGLLRLSLTEKYLNLSCVVLFFLKGEEKRGALNAMLRAENLPAGRIKGQLRTYIFTDI